MITIFQVEIHCVLSSLFTSSGYTGNWQLLMHEWTSVCWSFSLMQSTDSAGSAWLRIWASWKRSLKIWMRFCVFRSPPFPLGWRRYIINVTAPYCVDYKLPWPGLLRSELGCVISRKSRKEFHPVGSGAKRLVVNWKTHEPLLNNTDVMILNRLFFDRFCAMEHIWLHYATSIGRQAETLPYLKNDVKTCVTPVRHAILMHDAGCLRFQPISERYGNCVYQWPLVISKDTCQKLFRLMICRVCFRWWRGSKTAIIRHRFATLAAPDISVARSVLLTEECYHHPFEISQSVHQGTKLINQAYLPWLIIIF